MNFLFLVRLISVVTDIGLLVNYFKFLLAKIKLLHEY